MIAHIALCAILWGAANNTLSAAAHAYFGH